MANDGAGWLARKLAGAAPPSQQQQYAPPTYAPAYQQPQPVYQQPQYTQPQPQQPGGLTQDEQNLIAGKTPEMAKAMIAASRSGGSRKAKEAMSDCPECGGVLMTQKKILNGVERVFEHCVACGYPLVQSSSHHGAANLAQSDGRVHQARSVGQGHTVEVVTEQGIMRIPTNFTR